MRSSLRASVAEGMTSEVFTACAGGAVLTGWALHLGADAATIGLLGALPLASQIFHLPGAFLTQTFGRRRLAIVTLSASRWVWAVLAVLPFADLPRAVALNVLLAVAAVSAVLAIIGNNAWTSWMGDLIPSRIRGRFFGKRFAILTFTGTIASLAAGVTLDALAPHGLEAETLGALAAIAAIAGGLSTPLLVKQHDPEPDEGRSRRRPTLKSTLAPWRDPSLRGLLRYQLVWNAGVAPAAAFIPFHMLSNLKLGFAFTAAHGVAVALVRVLAAPLWGRAVDRLGARPVLAFCSYGIALIPAAWLFVTPDRLWPILIDVLIAGVLWAGHGVAMFDLPLAVSPRAERPQYLGAFATAGGIGFAAASIAAGALAETLPPTIDLFGGWMAIHVLFAVSAFGRLTGAALAHSIHEPDARPLSDLLRHVAIGTRSFAVVRRSR